MTSLPISACKLHHQRLLDVEGYPARIEHIRTDSRGRYHDMSQMFKRNRSRSYGGKVLHLDEFNTDLPQYSGYRDTVVSDNDEDESMDSLLPLESDVDMLSNKTTLSPTRSVLDTPRQSRTDKYVKADIPKLRDIGLDSIQIKSVVQQPNHIPRDFHFPADRHYRELAIKYRQLERLEPPAQKRKFFGFDAQELLLNGALNCSPCRTPDLNYNPTLAIFSEDIFQDTPQSVLEALKPALALAELIMLKGNPRFWVDIACGLRMPDYERIQKEATRAEKLLPVHQVTQNMKDTTVAKLQALGKRLVIKFEQLENVYGCCSHPIVMPVHRPLLGYLNHGELWPSNSLFKLQGPYPSNPWDQPTVIKLDSKLFAAAKRFSLQKFPDVAAKLRYTFFFAVNLLHELSHAFEAKCGHGNYYELISKDRGKPGALSRSYFSRYAEAKYKHHDIEMGAAFEYETFGGRVHPINHDFSMNYGLNVYLGGGKGYSSPAGIKAIRNGQPFGRAVPMGYIEELHQQSYWDRPDQNGVLIPLCGPETYIMHTTSTMAWREHLLENDAAHGVDMLEQAFDEQTHISKRVKTGPATTRPSTKSPDGKRVRRLLQTKLRKYPKKADAATAQIKAELIAKATLEEAQLKNALTRQIVQDYQTPSPTQPAIDDQFHYINTEEDEFSPYILPQLNPTSDLYDPLLKLPHQFTINDKWLLLEDYAILAHGWSSSMFLARRAAMGSAIPPATGLEPILKNMCPSNNPENWGEIHCGMLRVLRERNPGRGLMVEKARRHAEREWRKEVWRVKREMEELVVRTEGSRVEWMRGRLDLGALGLEGMDVESWEKGPWRGMLEELRDNERRDEKMPAKEAGKGVGIERPEEPSEQANKITRYFSKDEQGAIEKQGEANALEETTSALESRVKAEV